MKLSFYNFFEKIENNTILYNTKSGFCSILDDESLDKLVNFNMDENSCNKLINKGVYVDDDINEFDLLLQNHEKIVNSDILSKFRILTTTGCNAKCYYCYEQGIKTNIMDQCTANAVADFIAKTSSNVKDIYIEWFGGEPLLNKKVISIITDKLHEKNFFNINSSIITNAYLINDEVVNKMVNEWHIKKVQITIDGVGSYYEDIKKLGKGSFERLIKNITLLVDNNIKVDIRLNFSPNRLDLLEQTAKYFSTSPLLTKIDFYPAKIFEIGDNDKLDHDEKLTDAFDILYKYKLMDKLELLPQSFTTCCMATYKNFFTIDPLGNLYKCDRRYDNKNSLGNVFDYNEKVLHDEKFSLTPLPDKCTNCKIFPVCWGGCIYERLKNKNTCCMSEKTIRHNMRLLYDSYKNYKKV